LLLCARQQLLTWPTPSCYKLPPHKHKHKHKHKHRPSNLDKTKLLFVYTRKVEENSTKKLTEPPEMCLTGTTGIENEGVVVGGGGLGFSQINDDVLQNILARLPALPFASAACVSKSWNRVCNRILTRPKLASALSLNPSLHVISPPQINYSSLPFFFSFFFLLKYKLRTLILILVLYSFHVFHFSSLIF
jgi:hypothetical protein